METEGMTKAQLSEELARLRERVADLERAEEDRRRGQNLSEKTLELIEFITRAQGLCISGMNRHALFEEMLQGLLSLTESEFGYIGEVFYTDEGECYQRSRAISNIAWDDESRRFYRDNWQDGLKFEGNRSLHGEILRTGEPVLTNDPEVDPRQGGKLPGGHPPIRSFLGLPIWLGGELVGTAGIANRQGGYDPDIIEFLEPFLKMCGVVIQSYRSEEMRETAEKEFRDSEKKARALLNASAETMLLVDRAGRILDLNTTASKRIAGEGADLIGKNVRELFSEEVHDRRRAEGEVVHRTKKPVRFEDQRDGRILDNTFYPIFDAEGEVSHIAVYSKDVTEERLTQIAQRENEAALRQSEERFRSLAEHAPDYVVLVDRSGKILFVNRTYGGVPKEEVIGSSMYDWVPRIFREDFITLTKRAFQSGDTGFLEYWNRTRAGQTVWHELHIGPVGTGDPSETAILIIRDVGERRRAEQALLRAKTEWERTFDTVPDLIMIVDTEYRIVRVNRAMADKLGMTPHEIVGCRCYELIHGTKEPIAACGHRTLMDDGKRYTQDFYEDRLGAWLHLSVSPLLDDEGRVVGSVHVASDITRTRLAAEALRESESKFRLLAEHIEDVFWMSTPGIGETIYVSPAYEKIWGRTRDSLYEEPKSFMEAIHPEDLDRVREQVAEHAFGSYHAQYRIIQPDGSIRWILDRGFPIRDEKGDLVRMCGLATDITERHDREEALERSQKQLRALATELARTEESERKRLAGELHDQVGQSLTALGINLGFVRSQLSDKVEERTIQRLDDALDLVEQTSESIRDVMMDLRPTLLDDYGLMAALRWYAEHFSRRTGIPVDVIAEGEIARLDGESETGLFRIAREALTNVAKHAHASRVTVRTEETNDLLRMTVIDDGQGFDPGSRETGHGKEGWGLLTMGERMHRMGGRLQVESASGGGTRVCAEVRRNG